MNNIVHNQSINMNPKIIRDPIPTLNLSELKKYNTNNVLEYAPYQLDENNNLMIDLEWWNGLTYLIRHLIKKNLQGRQFKLEKLKIPLSEPQSDNLNKDLLTVYQSYIDGFDFHIWWTKEFKFGIWSGVDVKLIFISSYIKPILRAHFIMGGLDLNEKDCPEDLEDLVVKIEEGLSQNPDKKYFIRLSSTSGKNRIPLKPINTTRDVIKRLTCNRLFVEQEYDRLEKDTYLVMIPWVDFDPRYEFRIFIVNGKITAGSPQHWNKMFGYSQEELETFQWILENDVEWINQLQYDTFVADVVFDIVEKRLMLIECNPFGAHSGAGSSLFNWVDDYDILHGKIKNQTVIRYQSIVKF